MKRSTATLTVKALLAVFLVVVLAGCGSKLKEEVKGTWLLENQVDDENLEVTYFDLLPDGKLDETTFFYEDSEDDDGEVYTMTFKSVIKGTWKLVGRDLEMNYDLSTLQVEFKDVKYKSSSVEENDELNLSLTESYSEYIKDDEESYYKTLYDYYKEDSGKAYLDIKIEGTTMSGSSSEGPLSFTKVDASAVRE